MLPISCNITKVVALWLYNANFNIQCSLELRSLFDTPVTSASRQTPCHDIPRTPTIHSFAARGCEFIPGFVGMQAFSRIFRDCSQLPSNCLLYFLPLLLLTLHIREWPSTNSLIYASSLTNPPLFCPEHQTPATNRGQSSITSHTKGEARLRGGGILCIAVEGTRDMKGSGQEKGWKCVGSLRIGGFRALC